MSSRLNACAPTSARVNMPGTLVARCPRHGFGMYAAPFSRPRQLRDGSSSARAAERLVVYGPLSLPPPAPFYRSTTSIPAVTLRDQT